MLQLLIVVPNDKLLIDTVVSGAPTADDAERVLAALIDVVKGQVNRSGITIRMGLDELRVLGRATQGVRLIELRGNDQIAAVARVDSDLNDEEENNAENPASEGTNTNGEAPEGEDGTDVDNA